MPTHCLMKNLWVLIVSNKYMEGSPGTSSLVTMSVTSGRQKVE